MPAEGATPARTPRQRGVAGCFAGGGIGVSGGPFILKNAVETADSTDNTDDRFVADIHTFTSQVKTAPLLSFCKDRYPCDLRNPRFLALRKLG
jgi:hypothetical protein